MDLAGHGPFEIKSDPEADDPAATVAGALEEFKSAVGDRVAALEAKSASDAKLAERVKAVETRLARPGAGAVEPKSAEGEVERKAFVSYLRRGEQRMPADEVKALTVASGPTAGFLAPVQFGAELLKRLVQFSPIRAYAKTVQISAPEITYPRRTSAIVAQWVGEIDPRQGSAPAFEQLTLTPAELAVYVDVSNQLLEDNAYDLEGELTQEFAENFAVAEGAAFVNGDGNKKPVGLLTSPQLATIETETVGALPPSRLIIVDDLIAIFHALPGVHAQNAVWLMNRNTLGLIRSMKDSTGRPLILEGMALGAPSTLLGRPVVEAIDMPDVAPGATPIIFGDLQGYRIVDRVGLSTLRDPFTLATVGQTRMHARKRTGGDVTHPDRFIKLAVAAAPTS